MIYALDTNTVSYFIQNNVSAIAKLRDALAAGNKIVIPSVVYYEIRHGFMHKPTPRKERAFSNMCSLYPIKEMSIEAWECAAGIYGVSRKTGKTIEDTDILIVALCIINNYTLVTNNTKHFTRIPELQFVDWTQS